MAKCNECGIAMTEFNNETFLIKYHDLEVTVENLSGSRCLEGGEVYFDTQSSTKYAQAGDMLIESTRV